METIAVLPQLFYTFDYPGDIGRIKDLVEGTPLASNDHNRISENSAILDNPELADFREWIEGCLKEVLLDQDYRFGLKITQSWVTFARRGMWHHRHTHPNAFLSGIFYLTSSGTHTWFSIPSIWTIGGEERLFPGFIWGQPAFKEVIHKQPTQPGKLVVFPASLEHSVGEHDLDDPRMTISFNTFPVGTFGVEEYTSSLTVN